MVRVPWAEVRIKAEEMVLVSVVEMERVARHAAGNEIRIGWDASRTGKNRVEMFRGELAT